MLQIGRMNGEFSSTRPKVQNHAAAYIIDAMPLTGVGKIFKPALKFREIEDALAEALRGAGVAVASMEASSDPAHGILIDVSVAGREEALARGVLGRFPFQCRLAIRHDS